MSDQPEQLPLFTSHIQYTVRLEAGLQTQDWPLVAARSLDEACDAMRGLSVFLIFTQGIYWGDEFNNPDSESYTGLDSQGRAVLIKVIMEDAYIDHEGNRL